jgi:signal peptidase
MTPRTIIVARVIRFATASVAIGLTLAVATAFVPTLLGREVMIVTTASMEPWAPVGSAVVTRMVDARTVGVGDVITFRPSDAPPTTHRVIEVTEHGTGAATFITKGDANEDPDPTPVRIAGDVAIAERVIPHLGRLLAAVRSPIAFLALALIGFAAAALERAVAALNRPRVRPMIA